MSLLNSTLVFESFTEFLTNDEIFDFLSSFVYNQSDFLHEVLRIFVILTRKVNAKILNSFGFKFIEIFTFVLKETLEGKFLKLALEGLFLLFSAEKEQKGVYQTKNLKLKFESLNGDGALLNLQHHQDIDVYNLVFMIYDECFQEEDDELK